MKPDLLPKFIHGQHYRDLDPVAEGHKRWRFKTTRGMRLPIKQMANILGDSIVFYHDAEGRIRGRHDRFGVYINEDYAWNGCSPKRWVWPLGWLGVPDFEDTRLASLFHDFHYQFARTEHFILHRSEADATFYHCIDMAGSPRIADIYHDAVVKYGSWVNKKHNRVFSTRRDPSYQNNHLLLDYKYSNVNMAVQ